MNKAQKNAEAAPDKEKQTIAVRIESPVSDAVIRMADENKRPRQWQVDLILRAGLKALGQEVSP